MKSVLMASTALLVLMSSAYAEQKTIGTGGEKGAYFNTFCPPIPAILKNAQFGDYTCKKSDGTVANIKNVLADPRNLGFVQLDVYAQAVVDDPQLAQKTSVIRELACEGVWFVTKNPRINTYADIVGMARRRLTFIVPPVESGSAATFEFMKKVDPDGIGQARFVTYAKDSTSVIDAVTRGTNGEVGMFVQFADPENANIKEMMKSGLKVIPAISDSLLKVKADGKEVYQVQSFALKGGTWGFGGKEVNNLCTPVGLITGNPAVFPDKRDQRDQQDMIGDLNKLPAETFLPKEDRIASLMKSFKKIGGSALDKVVEEAKHQSEKWD